MLQSMGWQRVGHDLATEQQTTKNCEQVVESWKLLNQRGMDNASVY